MVRGSRGAGRIGLPRAPSAASRTRSSPTPSSAAGRHPVRLRASSAAPICRQGHVVLDLCTADGLERRTVSKRRRSRLPRATQARTGADASERRGICVTLRECSASPSSREHRRASARRPRGGSRRRVGTACSSPAARTASAPSPSEIGGEVEVVRRRRPGGRRGARGPRPRAPPVDPRCSSTTRASRPQAVAEVDLDLVDGGRPRELPRRRLDDTRAAPRATAPRAARSSTHIVNVVSVAGAVAFAPSGAYTAAKHAQLAFSRSLQAIVAWERHRRAHDPAGLRRDRGLPAAGAARASRSAPHRRAAGAAWRRRSCGSSNDAGREVVVPWFPYRPASSALRRSPRRWCHARRPRRRERAVRSRRRRPGERVRAPHDGDVDAGPGRRRHRCVVGHRRGDGTAARSRRAGTACSWHAARTCSGASRPSSAGEVEVCDVADRAAVADDDRSHPRAAPRVRPARQQRRHPRSRHLRRRAARRVERALAVNYLGCVWMTRGLLDGMREAARERRARRTSPTIASIGGSIVFTPGRPVLRLEARPGRVLALAAGRACTAPGSRCTRSCPGS